MNETNFPLPHLLRCLFLGQLSLARGRETSYSSPHIDSEELGLARPCAHQFTFSLWAKARFFCLVWVWEREKKTHHFFSLKDRTRERHWNYLAELSIWEDQPKGRGKNIAKSHSLSRGAR